MQPLDHDMDELMRKAAEEYPVRPQGADWEKVAQQLDASDGAAARSNRHELLKKLLLLLPFVLASFVCDRFLRYEYAQLKNKDTVDTFESIEANTSSLVTKSKKKEVTTTPVNSGLNNRSGLAPLNTHEHSDGRGHADIKNNVVLSKTSEPGNMNFLKRYKDALVHKDAGSFFPATPFYKASEIVGTQTITPNIQHTAITQKPIIVLDDVKRELKKPKAAANGKGYFSLLMGPDFSQVKDQRMEAVGYSIGMLAGYNLNRKWAVEAGVFWDRKNYYSKGEYFKTDKINLPPGTKVLKVDGYCAMFEIPLNIRYTIIQKKNMAFTAAAGVSSYIMKTEDYDYKSWNSISSNSYYGNAKREWASKDWFSIANLSVGYEHNFGPKNKIRIEPYLKLPLQGVGIGSLPLRSAGVLVGVTRTIH